MTTPAATLHATRGRARHSAVSFAAAPPRGSVIYGMQPARPQPDAAWWSTLPATLRAPSEARRHTRFFLERCRNALSDDFADLAELVVSELVANAANAMIANAGEHATAAASARAKASSERPAAPRPGPVGTLNLSFRLFPDHLLIEVIDTARGVPRPRLDPDPDATSQRGLAVVHDITEHQWGWFRRRDGRKVVYARLLTPQTPGEGDPAALGTPRAPRGTQCPRRPARRTPAASTVCRRRRERARSARPPQTGPTP